MQRCTIIVIGIIILFLFIFIILKGFLFLLLYDIIFLDLLLLSFNFNNFYFFTISCDALYTQFGKLALTGFHKFSYFVILINGLLQITISWSSLTIIIIPTFLFYFYWQFLIYQYIVVLVFEKLKLLAHLRLDAAFVQAFWFIFTAMTP